MMQEIIVFALFGAIIGFYLYRLFFKKDSQTGGCDKCGSTADKKQRRKKEQSVK